MYSIKYTFRIYLNFLLEKPNTKNPVKLCGSDQFSSDSRTINIELFEIVELMSFDDDEMISIYHNFIVLRIKESDKKGVYWLSPSSVRVKRSQY